MACLGLGRVAPGNCSPGAPTDPELPRLITETNQGSRWSRQTPITRRQRLPGRRTTRRVAKFHLERAVKRIRLTDRSTLVLSCRVGKMRLEDLAMESRKADSTAVDHGLGGVQAGSMGLAGSDRVSS